VDASQQLIAPPRISTNYISSCPSMSLTIARTMLALTVKVDKYGSKTNGQIK
jgi:hypothetical protein